MSTGFAIWTSSGGAWTRVPPEDIAVDPVNRLLAWPATSLPGYFAVGSAPEFDAGALTGVTATPEPGAIALMLVASSTLLLRRRRSIR